MPPKAPKEGIQLVEHYDPAALGYIIKNYDQFTFRPDTDKKAMLTQISKYKARSSDGSKTVTYHQPKQTPGRGRFYAAEGQSLQGITREIRNALAYHLYEDVDFSNCHPAMLLQFCEHNNISAPCLRHYIHDREAVLNEMGDKSNAKKALLAVMNGGNPNPELRQVVNTAFYAAFIKEIVQVTEAVLRTSQGAPFLALAVKAHGKDYYNLQGSAISTFLCDLENNMLMSLREFLEEKAGRKVGVLVFDGCMVERDVEKGLMTDELLKEASDYVCGATGYRLALVVKDMTKDNIVYTRFNCMVKEPRYAKDDNDAAAHFLEDIKDCVRSCKGRVIVKIDHAWCFDNNHTGKVLLARAMGANIVRVSDEGGSTRPMSGNTPGAERIVKATMARMALECDDPEFMNTMWSSVIGKLPFKNGIWDFRAGRFSTYDELTDVYPPFVIARDFPIQRPREELMREVYGKVLLSTLGDDVVVATYLQLCARAAAGEYTDKQWVAMCGERDSGKGQLQRLNQSALGTFVNTVNANQFLIQNFAATDNAKAKSWMLDCEFKRMTYTNEIKMDVGSKFIKLDGNMIKGFQSGGDPMYARKNYDNEREFYVASKLFMNLNAMPTICPTDATDSMVLINFPYKFVSKDVMEFDPQPFYRLRDDAIKEYCMRPDVADAYLWLLIDAYQGGRVVPCPKIKNDTMQFREDIGDDLAIMTKSFKFTGNKADYVTYVALKEFAVWKHIDISVAKARLVRMGGKPSENCERAAGCRGSRGYTGIKYIVGAVEDDTEDPLGN